MLPGQHIVEQRRVPELARAGLDLPEARCGLLDALRMLEGHLPPPAEGQPLVVLGLDALLAAAPADPGPVLRVLRDALVEGRSWLNWKRIPVVLLVSGALEDRQDDAGLLLRTDGRAVSLAPLLGTRLQPARAGQPGWFWSPQLG